MSFIPTEDIQKSILLIRGHKVLLASVINGPIAINASIQVVRAFIQLRQILSSHVDLAKRLDGLEKKYDHQFSSVFDAIRSLMQPPVPPRRRIGI